MLQVSINALMANESLLSKTLKNLNNTSKGTMCEKGFEQLGSEGNFETRSLKYPIVDIDSESETKSEINRESQDSSKDLFQPQASLEFLFF